jgi:hypothetical protein
MKQKTNHKSARRLQYTFGEKINETRRKEITRNRQIQTDNETA